MNSGIQRGTLSWLVLLILLTKAIGCGDDTDVGNSTTRSVDSDEAVSTPSPADAFARQAIEYIDIVREQTDLLKTVTDVESAHKAAPRLDELRAMAKAANDRLNAMGQAPVDNDLMLALLDSGIELTSELRRLNNLPDAEEVRGALFRHGEPSAPPHSGAPDEPSSTLPTDAAPHSKRGH